jgi:hypothetical protein
MRVPLAGRIDIEFFRVWVMQSASTSSVQELRRRIALYGPDDLPKMIGIVGEAEIACMGALEDLNQQMRDERREASAQHAEHDMSILIWSEAAERCDSRIRWLQNLRRYLEKEQQQHEDADPPTLR